ncbi:MAG TPA: glycosyltransferase [Candidatus Angelobacter sp.]|jgi:glycosyltransferase involved in cell wall biosynthesis|nr:glycosyltransferase [Candidatus Angelobacter sp.]
MRILLSSNHRYPAAGSSGSGTAPREFPSGSGFIIHDLLAKGLAEAGHQVFYLLPRGAEMPLPSGVILLHEPVFDVDVVHTMTFRDYDLVRAVRQADIPWVATCHLDPTVPGRTIPDPIEDNWIFVSRTLAHSLGRSRYVLNGIDPGEHLFCDTPDDYFLFMASLEWSAHKGLDVALNLAARHNLRLIVAGTGKTDEIIDQTVRQCRAVGAEFAGDVRGIEKARLLAQARALLFPTQVNEAFGLVMVEALLSGTPVIASSNGACPEIVTSEMGFVCRSEQDYDSAIRHIGEISRPSCRENAINRFHYRRMVADYVREYCAEIASGGNHAPAPAHVIGARS